MHFLKTPIFTFLYLSLFGIACNEAEKAPVQEAPPHPMLVKTIGDPRYGNVYCSLQDKTGKLWFGTTENGLYEYDGKSFRQFLITDGLISNNISSMLEDNSGKIWIGTDAGLCVYNGSTFSKIQIPIPKYLTPNTNKYYSNKHTIYSMLQARNGKIWLVTIDGVYIYDGKSFELFEMKEAANSILGSNDKVERILEDREGNIWLGGRTNEGVFKYDGKTLTNLKLEVLFQNGPKPKPHNWAWPQTQDKAGNIWFSNWGGAYCYNGKTFTSFSKKDGLPGIVARIIATKNGNIWLGGDGMCLYNPSAVSKKFTCFMPKSSMTYPGIWSILEDTSGNIWVGTRETGLYLFDGKMFTSYSAYKH